MDEQYSDSHCSSNFCKLCGVICMCLEAHQFDNSVVFVDSIAFGLRKLEPVVWKIGNVSFKKMLWWRWLISLDPDTKIT